MSEEEQVSTPVSNVAVDPRRWILLRVGDRQLAIEAGAAVGISGPRPLIRLPGAPAAVLGIINHQGVVVTVVDLGLLLGGAALTGDDHRLVLVRRGSDLIALAASDVLGFAESPGVDGVTARDIIDPSDLLRDIF